MSFHKYTEDSREIPYTPDDIMQEEGHLTLLKSC